jgi:hypothetical protein
MACEVTLSQNGQEIQRIRIPYNSRGLFDVLNETLGLEDIDALSWADYSGDTPRRLDDFEIKDLHKRLMNALSDLMLKEVWRYPNGSPLTTLEKMEIQNLLVELLSLLREAQRAYSHKEVLVRA